MTDTASYVSPNFEKNAQFVGTHPSIIFVRHAARFPVGDKVTYQYAMGVPLTDKGKQDALDFGRELRHEFEGLRFSGKVLSSPSHRCKDTAARIICGGSFAGENRSLEEIGKLVEERDTLWAEGLLAEDVLLGILENHSRMRKMFTGGYELFQDSITVIAEKVLDTTLSCLSGTDTEDAFSLVCTHDLIIAFILHELFEFKSIDANWPQTLETLLIQKLKDTDSFRAIYRGQIVEFNFTKEIGMEAKGFIEKGGLVPDDLVSKLMAEELGLTQKSWLLDGYPRTVPQAEFLQSIAPLDFVIDLDVPFDVIVERLKMRWIHAPSGRVYNLEFNPPKTPGKDDVTGESLVQREDDKPETVLQRLHTYKGWEEPMAQFYKDLGILSQFSGRTTNEIWPQVFKFLETKMPALKDMHDYN